MTAVAVQPGLLARSALYRTFVREERQFCAALHHLLLVRGPNLTRFLDLANAAMVASGQPRFADRHGVDVSSAQVYVEFAFLRDYWDSLGLGVAPNDARRTLLQEILGRLPNARGIEVPNDPACLNKRFGKGRNALPHTEIGQPG